jgi:hypothetical protein
VSPLDVAAWLEATSLSTWVRESRYGFAIVVAVHILGLAFSAGVVIWFDLRLLGVSMAGIPVSLLYRRLMPWLVAGFGIMFASGAVLLASFATAAYGNTYFWIKMTALVMAGVNAFVYHRVTERSAAAWDDHRRPPLPARIAGIVSVTIWASVIVAGRMMSYTMF